MRAAAKCGSLGLAVIPPALALLLAQCSTRYVAATGEPSDDGGVRFGPDGARIDPLAPDGSDAALPPNENCEGATRFATTFDSVGAPWESVTTGRAFIISDEITFSSAARSFASVIGAYPDAGVPGSARNEARLVYRLSPKARFCARTRVQVKIQAIAATSSLLRFIVDRGDGTFQQVAIQRLASGATSIQTTTEAGLISEQPFSVRPVSNAWFDVDLRLDDIESAARVTASVAGEVRTLSVPSFGAGSMIFSYGLIVIGQYTTQSAVNFDDLNIRVD